MNAVKSLHDDAADDFVSESHLVSVNGQPVMVDFLFTVQLVGSEFESQVREKEIALAVSQHCRGKFGAGRLTRLSRRRFQWQAA